MCRPKNRHERLLHDVVGRADPTHTGGVLVQPGLITVKQFTKLGFTASGGLLQQGGVIHSYEYIVRLVARSSRPGCGDSPRAAMRLRIACAARVGQTPAGPSARGTGLGCILIVR